jgi:hypothetical protein
MHRPSSFRRLVVAALGVGATALVAFVAIGAGGATANAANPHGQGDQSAVQIYVAQLAPLNASQIDGPPVTGSAMIFVHGDTIRVLVHGRNLSVGPHAMHIHTGTTCPTAAADVNHDGFVDVIEGLPAYGPILVPLDSDLSTQAAGTFPSANAAGNLNYHASTSLSAMLADLHAPDPNTSDAVVKLAPGEDLNLAMRHIVIHGVAASTALPSTVASLGTAPATATLPVACGPIVRVR